MNLPAVRETKQQKQQKQQKQTAELSYRAKLLQQVNPRIPLTGEGLPVGYYRADLLPREETDSGEEVQSLKNAYIDLSFDHGYPTLTDGRPFWAKLDFEPSFEYGAFQIFLDLEKTNDGPRELNELSEHEELLQLFQRVYPDRVTKANGSGPQVGLYQLVNEASVLYSWRPRAKAYDLYKEAAYRHTRLRRQMSAEDKHFKLAEKLLTQLEQKFNEPDFWKGLQSKTAVDLLGKLVAIQRVSTGLPAQGPLPTKETSQDTTFEMILRTLGQKASQGSAGATYDQFGHVQQGREMLDRVLEDTDTAKTMQELIIRVTKATQESAYDDPTAGVKGRVFKSRNRNQEVINDDDLVPFDVNGAPGQNANLDDPSV